MGKTATDKAKDKSKADTKKKPAMKDILQKKNAKGGKAKKKKWSKTKSKEKLNNAVFWTKVSFDKLYKDVITKETYLTPSIVSEKLKINVSLARAAIQQLLAEQKIKAYNNDPHSRFCCYVKTEAFQKEVDSKPVEVSKDKKGGKQEPKAPVEQK